MKKKILLIDESLTVQKVVALTLDRESYSVQNVKTRSEAMKSVLEAIPSLILVSDQIPSIQINGFAAEVSSWVGKDRTAPPLVLITSHDLKEFGTYKAVLKKPFAPKALQSLVSDLVPSENLSGESTEAEPDSNLQKRFQDSFSDEADLVRQTFESDASSSSYENSRTPESIAELWGHGITEKPKPPESQLLESPPLTIMDAEDSMAYKASLENRIDRYLRNQNLEEVIGRLVEKMVPGLVEKVARDRIDALLKAEAENLQPK